MSEKKASIKLSEEDRKELVKLYHRAQTTPVMALTTQDMIDGRDWATLAWNDVRNKMDELGKKYGFDPKKMKGIDQTGKVQL